MLKSMIGVGLLAITSLLSQGCTNQSKPTAPPTFRQVSDTMMPHMGAGNWVVIADASFPKSSHAGWRTTPMNIDPIEALRDVLASSAAYGHVTPVIWVDRELMAITPSEVPGIDQFRSAVQREAGEVAIDSSRTQQQIIDRLRQVSQTHRVAIIKTPNPLPYSTIYVEFLHGNWTPAQEAALRARLGG